MTKEEVSAIENYLKEISQYLQEQAMVFQQIASTILDSLYLKIKGKPTVKEAWVDCLRSGPVINWTWTQTSLDRVH